MIFQNLAREVGIGANSYLLQFADTRIVLDAGMHPKVDGPKAAPQYDLLSYDSIDTIFISHSHFDHIGTLPMLSRQQPKAEVIMSTEASHLTRAMLHNSVSVMCHKQQDEGIADYPLFTHKEVDNGFRSWMGLPLKRPYQTSGDSEVKITLYPAGHVLGACGALFEHEGHSVFYTGDVNFEGGEIVMPADFPRKGIDTLIMETTRGATPRSSSYSRESEIDRMAKAIRTTAERGGSVLIPLFALGRTQETLLILHKLKQQQAIPDMLVYMGGLSAKITRIFDDLSDEAHRNHRGFKILREIDVTIPSKAKSKRGKVPTDAGTIYAISSGMMSENTVSHSLAPSLLQDPKNSLILVGYSDPESPAGQIRAAGQGGVVEWSKGELELKCPIHEFDFSGHAEREQLLNYAVELAPRQILLVHGDDDAMSWFHQQLEEKLPDTEVIIPKAGEPLEIH